MIMDKEKNINFFDQKLLTIGKFGSPYGIRGWVKILSFTEIPEYIFHYKPWLVRKTNLLEIIKLNNWKKNNKTTIAKIDGINDRTQAELIKNQKIFINNHSLPKLTKGNYYWKDIIGCTVININNYIFGNVKKLIETGSNDVLVVRSNCKDFAIKERFIPFIEQKIIKNINISNKIIKVDWNPNFF